jgi:hypothetical protein
MPRKWDMDPLDNTNNFGAGSNMRKNHSAGQLLDGVRSIRREYGRRPVLVSPQSSGPVESLSDSKVKELMFRYKPRQVVGDITGKMTINPPEGVDTSWEKRVERRTRELEAAEAFKRHIDEGGLGWKGGPEVRPGAPINAPGLKGFTYDTTGDSVMTSTMRRDFFPRGQETMKEWRTGKDPTNCRQKDGIYEFRENLISTFGNMKLPPRFVRLKKEPA